MIHKHKSKSCLPVIALVMINDAPCFLLPLGCNYKNNGQTLIYFVTSILHSSIPSVIEHKLPTSLHVPYVSQLLATSYSNLAV